MAGDADSTRIPQGMSLPNRLSDINASFLTQLLKARGLLGTDNAVASVEEAGVGMTAGYFSDIKKIHCQFNSPTDCPAHFVAKAWPDFEMLPEEAIGDMFIKDIKGYMFPAERFYPRPKVYLADFDLEGNRYGLIMEDVGQFAEQKIHEHELDLDEVLQMIPGLVDSAIAWEGCDSGADCQTLDRIGVQHWGSDENLTLFKQVMPAGAKLFDKALSTEGSDLINGTPWKTYFGTNVSELFTRKIDAHFARINPEQGATCTLSHGDLRGDNLFFCPKTDAQPHGWLTIDFQLLFKGPVPSDLAYLMSSGSVLPTVYEKSNRDLVLKTFFDLYKTKTKCYPNYGFEQFEAEFSAMVTVMFIYYIGMGGAIWRAAAFDNEQPGRIELGSETYTEADLSAEELRKRMWWRKTILNNQVLFSDLGLVELWKTMPDNASGMGEWVELPPHLIND